MMRANLPSFFVVVLATTAACNPATTDTGSALDGGATADLTNPADLAAPPDFAAPADLATTPDLFPGHLIEHIVAPKDTDPRIDNWLDNHYAYLDTRAPVRPQLVVHLAGASGTPQGTTAMLQEEASYGFHVIGLRYCNDYLIVNICNADTDPDCHGKLRLEAFDGMDHSPHIMVTTPNGIESRLAKLLAYLDMKFPGEGWGAFLDGGGAPLWPWIIVSGHSHGASAAGRISKVRPLAGAAMLSGPYDSKNGVPALWTTEQPMTPDDRVFGFTHTLESQHSQHLTDWKSLGLDSLGMVATVDGKASPWGGTHEFQTAIPPPMNVDPHGMTTAGGVSPKMNGVYSYRPVWRRMLGL